MAKKNQKKKSATIMSSNVRKPGGIHRRYRAIVLVSITGIIIIAGIAFLFPQNDSGTMVLPYTLAKANQAAATYAENTLPVASAGHAPSIHFPEPSYDFGSISQEEKVTHTFVVRNMGNEPLKLIRAHGS